MSCIRADAGSHDSDCDGPATSLAIGLGRRRRRLVGRRKGRQPPRDIDRELNLPREDRSFWHHPLIQIESHIDDDANGKFGSLNTLVLSLSQVAEWRRDDGVLLSGRSYRCIAEQPAQLDHRLSDQFNDLFPNQWRQS